MHLFRKKQPEKLVIEQPADVKVEKQEKTSYLDFYRKLHKKGGLKEPTESDKQELLKKLFPRSIDNMVAIDTKTGSRVAMDGIYKPATYENDLPLFMIPFFSHSFIGWQACALLTQNAYIRKACEIPARDAIAVDYKLHYADADDNNPDTDKEEEEQVLQDLKMLSDRKMKIKNICRDANIFKKTYGQILVVPTFNVDVDMSEPFDIKKIKKGTYTGMQIIQPFWVTYQMGVEQLNRPDKAGFYEPEYYTIPNKAKIHKSWIIKLVNGVCPDILKPVYYYGGIPLTQMIYERVYCAEKVANEAPKLALTKRLLTIDGDVYNLTANSDSAYETLQTVASIRDNFGFMVKEKDTSVNQIDTSLTDFDALIMTQFQLVAAIAEMPVTKLMKTQLKGLANSGDYEMKDYAQNLKEIQESDFNRILLWHYQLLSLSEKGKDLNIDIVWDEIDTPTALEQAQIESQQAQTDATYVGSGIIDATEVRTMLRSNDDSRFHNLSEEMPDDLAGMEEMGEEESVEEKETSNVEEKKQTEDSADEYWAITDEDIEEALDESEIEDDNPQYAYMFDMVADK
jgi:hypothetical protein